MSPHCEMPGPLRESRSGDRAGRLTLSLILAFILCLSSSTHRGTHAEEGPSSGAGQKKDEAAGKEKNGSAPSSQEEDGYEPPEDDHGDILA